MIINIEASTYFKKYLEQLNFQIEVSDASTIVEVINQLKLPQEQVGFVTVNNKRLMKAFVSRKTILWEYTHI